MCGFFFLLPRTDQLVFFGSFTIQIPCALHEPANCNTMSRIPQAGNRKSATQAVPQFMHGSDPLRFPCFPLSSRHPTSPPSALSRQTVPLPSASLSFAVFYHLLRPPPLPHSLPLQRSRSASHFPLTPARPLLLLHSSPHSSSLHALLVKQKLDLLLIYF
jgi:hypothetical protein